MDNFVRPAVVFTRVRVLRDDGHLGELRRGRVLQHHALQSGRVDRLEADELVDELVHERAVHLERARARVVRVLDKRLDLDVDEALRLAGGHLRRAHAAAVGRLPRDRRREHVLGGSGAEAPLRDHAPRQRPHLLQIIRSARGHLLAAEDQLLRDAAAQSDGELALEEAVRVEARLHAVLGRREESEPARAVGPRDDSDLCDVVVARRQRGHDGVPGFVVRHELLPLHLRLVRLRRRRGRLLHAHREAINCEIDLVK
mmetsp:Transcript_25058/g.84232  ORF Transcript_25058/g.84232 Transcript_25058/m.84232 type:complete len:257 (-) Transcript_25058:1373-2143(-)